jgi:hypothetical protein
VKRALVLEVMDKTIVETWSSMTINQEPFEQTPSKQDL